MQATAIPTPTVADGRSWRGVALSALPLLFLAFDGAMKLANPSFVVESSIRLGLPPHVAPGLGALELALVVLYLLPRTAVLGAVLWTGYLGGAVAMHLRLSDPLFSHTLFPVYVAAPLWAGLVLRDARLRALVRSSLRNS